MLRIAPKNLLHDKPRLLAAGAGVVVSIVLVMSLGGLFLACWRQARGLIDNAGGDLWLMSHGTACVDRGEPISRRRRFQAMGVPGVEWAEPLLVRITHWRLEDGRREVAEVVGVLPTSRLNVPWDKHRPGSAFQLPRAILIDERERERFGTASAALSVGDTTEIMDHRASIAAFTTGIASFTAIPYVFTTHGNAARFTSTHPGDTTFVIVGVEPGQNVQDVQARLRARLPDLDVYTAEEFSAMTGRYWMLRTGVGVGMVFAAVLGLTVGCIMVSQTIYAMTLSRIPEFATLKALGMSAFGLVEIVVAQAVLLGLSCYGIGVALATVVARFVSRWELQIDTPLMLYVAMFCITIALCVAASATSILKVLRLPPASVFGGN